MTNLDVSVDLQLTISMSHKLACRLEDVLRKEMLHVSPEFLDTDPDLTALCAAIYDLSLGDLISDTLNSDDELSDDWRTFAEPLT